VKGKIKPLGELEAIVAEAKHDGKTVVFANGCFDLLHSGHLHLLSEAKKQGDILIVATNSDSSVKSIKGPGRPVFPQRERVELLAALENVDYVTVFDETDPREAIRKIRPQILVKGGDWPKEQIVGKELVEKVVTVPYHEGYSTTKIIERIRGT